MLGHIIKRSDEKKRHQRGPQMGQNLEADVEALASKLALKKYLNGEISVPMHKREGIKLV